MMLSPGEVLKVVNNADMLKTRPEKFSEGSPSHIRKRRIGKTQNLDISTQRLTLSDEFNFLS